MPGVAQRVGELLAEEGVAVGLLEQQVAHLVGQGGDAQALADDAHRLLDGEPAEGELGRPIALEEHRVLRQRPRDGPGREQDEERIDLLHDGLGDGPGRGVEPVGVLDDQHHGARLGDSSEEGREDQREVRRADLALHLGGLGRLLEAQRQQGVEQGREGRQRLVAADGLDHPRPELLGGGASPQPEGGGEHASPCVVRRVSFDAEGLGHQHRHVEPLGAAHRLGDDPRLADPRLAVEHQQAAAALAQDALQSLGDRVELLSAPDDLGLGAPRRGDHVAGRSEHRDGPRDALDPPRREDVVDQALLRRPEGRLVHDHRALGDLHQP